MDAIDLKKAFEKRAAEILEGLNELETMNAQLRGELGGTGIAVGSHISQAREQMQKGQRLFSGAMAGKVSR